MSRDISVGRLNRYLRKQMDALFMALCDTDVSAQTAMGELWGSGEFDCGPQDYDYIVRKCLDAIEHSHTNTVCKPH